MRPKLIDLPDQDLLTGLIRGEAEGEDFIGKLAVACVVRTRKQDSRWPYSWKDVMLQPLQFSCLNDIPRHSPIPDRWWEMFSHKRCHLWWRECWATAWLVLNEYADDITGGANHYCAPALLDEMPDWAKDRQPIYKHGGHWFYNL